MPERTRDLYTASEVAGLCQVDLKTIHNWSERGEIRHFRTPGRHLRFRQVDVVEFLRKYGYPVPDSLLGTMPRVHVIDDDGSWLKQISRGLGKRFTVTTFDDAIDGIIAIGADVPDAVVLDVKMPDFDGLHCLDRLHELPATRKIKVVAFSGHAELRKRTLEHGAAAFVAKPDVGALVTALDQALDIAPVATA